MDEIITNQVKINIFEILTGQNMIELSSPHIKSPIIGIITHGQKWWMNLV